MKEKKYSVIKAISWYTIGNLFVRSIGFFVLPLISKLLSTVDYGIYTAFISTSTLLDSIIIFGLTPTIRMAKYDEKTDYNSYTSSIIFIPTLLSIAFCLIINIFFKQASFIWQFDRLTWNLMMVFCATNAACLILSNRLVLDGQYKKQFIYLLISTLASIVLFLLFAKIGLFNGRMYLNRIISQIIGNFLSLLFLIKTIGFESVRKEYLFKGVYWGAPIIVHTFVISLFEQMDTQLINKYSDFASLGVFGMAKTLSLIPATLEASFESAWNPWFYTKINEGAPGIKRANNTFILIFDMLMIEFMLIIPEVIKVMTNTTYWGSLDYLLPMAINYAIELLYIIPLNIQYFHKKTKNIMRATIISTIFEIIIMIIFINIFGVFGAVYAKILAKILLLLIHYVSAQKADKNKYFSLVFSMVGILVMLLINAFVIFNRDNFIIRFITFMIIFILLIIYILKKKNYILEVFNGD